jgi:uncharacterized protein
MPQRSVIRDPFKYAFEERRLTGRVALSDLHRLSDMLVDQAGEVEYSVVGEIGVDRKPRLRIAATGTLALCCQRCLERIDWPLDIEAVLQLVKPGQTIPEEELEIEEFDAIEAEPDMDVPGLVEDEIVLALTIAPRHENCDAPSPLGGTSRESPLAALAKLRKGGGAE